MATIGKKKHKEIERVSVIHDVLKDILKDDADFLDTAPDMWQKSEKEIYDLLIAHETKLKEEIKKILERKR